LVSEFATPVQVQFPQKLTWIAEDTLALEALNRSGHVTLVTLAPTGIIAEVFSPVDSNYSRYMHWRWSAHLNVFFVITLPMDASSDTYTLEELHMVDLEGNIERILSPPSAYQDGDVYQARYDILSVELDADSAYVF